MNDLRIVRGNEFAILIKVKAFKYDGTEIEDFNLSEVTDLYIAAHVNAKVRVVDNDHYQVMPHNTLKIVWTDREVLGEYSLEVCGQYEGSKWRFFDKTPIFTIVNTNAEANIPAQSIIEEDFYQVVSTDVNLWSAAYNNKIDYIGEDGYVYKWNNDTQTYTKSNISVKGNVGESAYQVAVRNGFTGSESEWLNSLGTQNSSRIHVGEFNSGNDCDEEGWYDSITYGRPEHSESDEKYIMYTSSNGTQMCWSKRNSGKSYHRISKYHPWIPLTHDDYGRSEANAAALKVYPTSNQQGFTFFEDNLVNPEWTNCSEIYSGDNLSIRSFNLTTFVTLHPDDIVEVNCFYRRGNSEEAFRLYPYDSDAYIYISDIAERDHSAAHLKSDFIKVKSLGSLDQDITDGSYQDLNTASEILSSNCGRHFVKYTGTKSLQCYIHLAGDFTTRSSWLALYNPGCKIHRAQSINSIS